MERQSETVVDEFISMVDEFRMKRRCFAFQDDLERAKRVQSAFLQRKQILHDDPGAVVVTTKLASSNSRTGRRVEGSAETADVTSFDPLNALKDIISDLYGRYDAAVRLAMEVCSKQDDVQRKATEILPDAEHLLSEVGDRVRKVSAVVIYRFSHLTRCPCH